MDRKMNLPPNMDKRVAEKIMERRAIVQDLTKRGLRICEIQAALHEKGFHATSWMVQRDQSAMGLKSESHADRIRRAFKEIPQLLDAGWSRRKIGEKMHLQDSVLNVLFALYGLDHLMRELPHQILSHEQIAEIQRAYASGTSIKALSHKYGISTSRLSTLARKGRAPSATPEMQKEMIAMRKAGGLCSDIAIAMSDKYQRKVTPAQVARIMRSVGLGMKR